MRVAFWTAFALVVYVYVGYPALLALWRRRRTVMDLPDGVLPPVTLLIAAHNEEAVLREKLENSLALDYPRDRLDIAVASDGSVDGTNQIARSYGREGVALHELTPRGGKTRALNAVTPLTTGDIVVLSDANTMFRADAIRKLVRHFADATVGCVSGDVRLVNSASEYAESEGLYYRYERFIQRQESALGAIVGADGGMYAIKRELFEPIPPDVVVDDFVISMNIARRGFQVRYEPEAVAIEQGTLSAREEFRRKVRVVAGGIQALMRGVGLPRMTQPILLWCYVSHKLARWFVPVCLLVILGTTAALALHPLYRAMLAAQVVFYAAAAAHPVVLRRARPFTVTSIPFYFCLVNGAALVGLWRGCWRRQQAAWTRTRRDEPGTVDISATPRKTVQIP